MTKTTPLYEQHLKLNATFIDFSGWLMPLHYGSQLLEHQTVRKDSGIFDVSHMTVVDFQGKDAHHFLRRLLANDISKLKPGKALYTCLLNENGGVKDDLIVYQLTQTDYRCVVNAGASDKDIAWFKTHSEGLSLTIIPRHDLAILAIQGPHALDRLKNIFNPRQYQAVCDLHPFEATNIKGWFVARTGYTGEKGVEILLEHNEAVACWQQCLVNEIKPIGLGARDTLRLEAGFNLYGQDMDETVTPYESNLGWTVDLKDPTRDFIGKKALLSGQPVTQQLVGIVLTDKGVCRSGMRILLKDQNQHSVYGQLTSGSFSPTLQCGIGLARIPVGEFSQIDVDIRGKATLAKIIKLPFIRLSK